MKDFISDASTLYWWLSVVVVGFAINICSPLIAKLFAKHFKVWADRRQQKLEEKEDRSRVLVESLSRDHSQQSFYQLQIVSKYQESTRLFLFGIICLMGAFLLLFNDRFTDYFSLFLGNLLLLATLISYVLSSREFVEARYMRYVLTEAMTRKLQIQYEQMVNLEEE